MMQRVIAAVAAAAALAVAAPASAQQLVPRAEDAAQPTPGQVWLGVAPVFQSWHREFGADGGEVPMAGDLEGPLLDQVSPGPGVVVDDLNEDAGALGFTPLGDDQAAVGDLEVRNMSAEVRAVALRLEAGVTDRLSADVMVPVVRTEVETSIALDPAGATLGGAAAALEQPGAFFGTVADARAELSDRLESGQVPPDREEEAAALLEASGDFATALQDRVGRNAVLPLGGTGAGAQIETFWAQLRSDFQGFGLAVPSLTLPDEGDPAFLDSFFLGTLAADSPGTTSRGWLAGETEIGLRYALLRRWDREEEGLDLRTTLGVRARLPFRDPNAVVFVDPTDLLGLPLGDGQRDVELSLYQDVGLTGWLELSATVRYGVQLADELTVSVRSPDRPLAPPSQRVEVERDLGDYLRARLSPRVRLNRYLSVGAEYRYWRRGSDRYRAGGGVDASALELRSEETRHRLGVGATYRPLPPEEGEPWSAAPEMGLVFQTPVAGGGGETPAAGLATFHVRVPVQVF